MEWACNICLRCTKNVVYAMIFSQPLSSPCLTVSYCVYLLLCHSFKAVWQRTIGILSSFCLSKQKGYLCLPFLTRSLDKKNDGWSYPFSRFGFRGIGKRWRGRDRRFVCASMHTYVHGSKSTNPATDGHNGTPELLFHWLTGNYCIFLLFFLYSKTTPRSNIFIFTISVL